MLQAALPVRNDPVLALTQWTWRLPAPPASRHDDPCPPAAQLFDLHQVFSPDAQARMREPVGWNQAPVARAFRGNATPRADAPWFPAAIMEEVLCGPEPADVELMARLCALPVVRVADRLRSEAADPWVVEIAYRAPQTFRVLMSHPGYREDAATFRWILAQARVDPAPLEWASALLAPVLDGPMHPQWEHPSVFSQDRFRRAVRDDAQPCFLQNAGRLTSVSRVAQWISTLLEHASAVPEVPDARAWSQLYGAVQGLWRGWLPPWATRMVWGPEARWEGRPGDLTATLVRLVENRAQVPDSALHIPVLLEAGADVSQAPGLFVLPATELSNCIVWDGWSLTHARAFAARCGGSLSVWLMTFLGLVARQERGRRGCMPPVDVWVAFLAHALLSHWRLRAPALRRL